MANYNDEFLSLMEKGEFVEAARHAIYVAGGKGSKSGAWAWADRAKEAAQAAGIQLDFGQLSWPDLEKAKGMFPKA